MTACSPKDEHMIKTLGTGGRILTALVILQFAPALKANVIFFSGNLGTDATVTSCGPSCTLGPSNTDDDFAQYAAVVYSFSVTTTTTLQAISYSYGGGVSQTGTPVAAGGLEPYFSLFDASGNFLVSSYGGPCPAGANSVGGNCYDAELDSGLLTPGTYQIALTAYANMSFAENNGPPALLADGFTGLGNLAPRENLNYAFDVILPGSTTTTAPEPATWGMFVAGSALLLTRVWKQRTKKTI